MTVWPQYCVLAMYCVGIGIAMSEKKGVLLHLLSASLMTFLLYKGGFFISLGWMP